MPRRSQHSKGPRLWLKPERILRNGSIERSVWCILDDGGIKRSTGCGPEDRRGAEDRLGLYLASKRAATRTRNRGAAEIALADVILVYTTDRAPHTARPKETAARLIHLLNWWGERTLADVTGKTCREYAASRGHVSSARRELEDLRAAIIHHRKEGLCREVVEVVVPDRPPTRERWLTRSEAAHLLWTAWKTPEIQKGKPTGRYPWRHVARFILVALKTGTRAGSICSAAFHPYSGYGWLDVDSGVFYRRPAGEAETKKRRPPVRVPIGLLAHAVRWRDRNRQAFVVEWNGRPVKDVDKAFRNVARAAGLPDVTPHVLRHTASTWLMQSGMDKWEVAGFVGMTPETLERIYAHHHPDFQVSAAHAIEHGHRKPTERIHATKREQARTNVVRMNGKSTR
jgi:integrase